MKPKAVVVGGSIAGVSCAHALILAGWDVVVIEKTCGSIKGNPTGAGLGLEPLALKLIQSWLGQPELLNNSTMPLPIDLNQATDSEKKIGWTLTRDDNFNFRSAHWGELHGLLHNALPPNIVLTGHHFLSFCTSDDKKSVKIKAKVLETDEEIEIVGNLLVAADGSFSSVRHKFLPDFKLRYSGYCAWRGIYDFSGNENSETIVGLRRAYPELGKCLYFNLGSGTHIVIYELMNKRLNWMWYINQPEPELKKNSVTMKVSSEMLQKLYREAEKVWAPELVRMIKETKEPFLNFIYDSEPLEQIVWDNVVLIGDAAHPTTPHGVKATNMSVVDAAVLGKCLVKNGAENLQAALKEYQTTRLPVVSKQVLYARTTGRLKQGLVLPDHREPFDPKNSRVEDYPELEQKNMPFFDDVPLAII